MDSTDRWAVSPSLTKEMEDRTQCGSLTADMNVFNFDQNWTGDEHPGRLVMFTGLLANELFLFGGAWTACSTSERAHLSSRHSAVCYMVAVTRSSAVRLG